MLLILGILWTSLGMVVLSYRVGSLAVVAVFVGVAFLFGGISWWWLARSTPGAGCLSWAALWAWPLGSSRSPGPASHCMSCRSWWPGTWSSSASSTCSARWPAPSCRGGGPSCCSGSPNWCWGCGRYGPGNGRCLRLVTLVGVWAIFYRVEETFAAFTVRQAGRRAERLVGWLRPGRACRGSRPGKRGW